MSTESVEIIHLRLREEIERLGLSLAEAARLAGEKSPQRIKDVVSGKQRCPSDLLTRLDNVGVDVLYVLTGRHAVSYQSQAQFQSGTVTTLATESGLLTRDQVLAIVLDAMHQVRRTLPATAVQALVETAMQLQRAGLAVNKSALEAQLRAVK